MDLIFALAPPTWTKHELVWSKWNAFEKNCQLKYDGWMGSKRQDYHHQQHPHINPKRVSQTKWHECEERLQRKWQHLIGLQTCRLTGPEMTPEYIVLPGTMIANGVAGKSLFLRCYLAKGKHPKKSKAYCIWHTMLNFWHWTCHLMWTGWIACGSYTKITNTTQGN